MIIGVPKEIKAQENRIALIPVGAEVLKGNGHQVIVEKNAGVGSGFEDVRYREAGAEIVDEAADVFARADMIMKVKEPQPAECRMIRENQIVFTYFHFAAGEQLTKDIISSKCIAIAYETVEAADRSLPLLVPMSEIAGRMSVQNGAKFLEAEAGGRGVLLGGVPGVEPGNVVILGGGVVGINAAKMAAGLGARVTILDVNLDRLRYLDDVMPKNVITLMSNPENIRKSIAISDLLIGAVLIPGKRAPHLVSREMLKEMKNKSVLVDVAVDQGGCIETVKPTTHDNPTYEVEGILHYCVANMPGAVPYTSTIALTNATLPYAVQIANKGYKAAMQSNREIACGANIVQGKVTYKAVADDFDLEYVPLEKIL